MQYDFKKQMEATPNAVKCLIDSILEKHSSVFKRGYVSVTGIINLSGTDYHRFYEPLQLEEFFDEKGIIGGVYPIRHYKTGNTSFDGIVHSHNPETLITVVCEFAEPRSAAKAAVFAKCFEILEQQLTEAKP